MTTKIEWTKNKDGSQGKTWNPVRGCEHASPGCKSCYAQRQAHRFSALGRPYHGLTLLSPRGPVWNGQVRLVPENLGEPLTWMKPTTIFVGSMTDIFHDDVPRQYIAAIFGVMALACHHTYQVLTKRSRRMREVVNSLSLEECVMALADNPWCSLSLPRSKGIAIGRQMKTIGRDPPNFPNWPMEHVWLGASVEDQRRADERLVELIQTQARLRMVSVEPLLEQIDLHRYLWLTGASSAGPFTDAAGRKRGGGGKGGQMVTSVPAGDLHWVIVGGESGNHARPFDLAWAERIQEQCREAGVAYFFKQGGDRCLRGGHPWPLNAPKGGDPQEWPEHLRVQQMPEAP
ncbi:MAG: DUF5131 family protein [Rhodanobacteraceae bacterium]|nr:DUF5131 family protein [Rhodanobacteraceae bacterium]